MTFVQMLQVVLDPSICGTLSAAAKRIGISPQYLNDLKWGRRLPSVEVTNKICDWLGRGPKGCAEWHTAAARTHGWKLPDVNLSRDMRGVQSVTQTVPKVVPRRAG